MLFKKNIDSNKYLLINSPYIDKKQKFKYSLAQKYDEIGYMPIEVGTEIEQLFSDSTYMIGIHRTGYSNVNEEYIKDVFNRGLINNMDILQGGKNLDDSYLDIYKTVSFMDDFITMNAELKLSHNYKNSSGCFIIKIPASYIGMGDGEIKSIYFKDKDGIKLLSEYIYGYISCNEKGELGSIVHNPNYTDSHIYIDSEDNLLYETRAKNRSRRR